MQRDARLNELLDSSESELRAMVTSLRVQVRLANFYGKRETAKGCAARLADVERALELQREKGAK
jgi:hypothetical protein